MLPLRVIPLKGTRSAPLTKVPLAPMEKAPLTAFNPECMPFKEVTSKYLSSESRDGNPALARDK